MRFLLSLLFILWIFMISSCTIEKRLYRDGYHITRTHAPHSSAVTEPKSEVEKTMEANIEVSAAQLVNTETSEVLSSERQPHMLTKEIADNEVFNDTVVPGEEDYGIETKRKETVAIASKEGAIHPQALASKNFGLASIGALSLSFIISIFGIASFGVILMLLALILAIIAIAKGKWSRMEMLMNPGKYSNYSDAITGLITGWIVVGLFIVFLIISFLLLILLLAYFL